MSSNFNLGLWGNASLSVGAGREGALPFPLRLDEEKGVELLVALVY